MTRFLTALLATLLGLVVAGPVAAQTASPQPSSAPRPWPSGDELRRELQQIGFAFRVDRDSGDWLGWAPRASVIESPALSLGSDGSAGATTTFVFSLFQTDLLGTDIDAALTGFMEVASRLPLDAGSAERTRRFVVADLLTEPPEILEPCYVRISANQAVVILVDAATGIATVRLGPGADALELDQDLDVGACAAIAPSVDSLAPGDPSSERLTIGTTGSASAAAAAFEPSEPVLEGDLVTVVLTFRNDSSTVQSLTFDEPLDSDTGPVLPGQLKLIVVRQLEPGDYAFYSSSDQTNMRGVLRISEPVEE